MPVGQLHDFNVGDREANSVDNAVLIQRAAGGDKEARSRLVDQYGRLIWSTTVRFNVEESGAANVVQTTWMRLIEHIDRIEQPDRIGAGLSATARNECLRHVPARKPVAPAGATTHGGPAGLVSGDFGQARFLWAASVRPAGDVWQGSVRCLKPPRISSRMTADLAVPQHVSGLSHRMAAHISRQLSLEDADLANR